MSTYEGKGVIEGEWLEKAFKARTVTPFMVKLSPFFEEITSDPWFDELMKKYVRSLGGA
jgi:hypothetical protein